MKLKKILAVALAATTALSSGVAYDMLGASADTVGATSNSSGYYAVGEKVGKAWNAGVPLMKKNS